MTTIGIPVTLPVGGEGKQAVGAWGMMLAIATEAALFAYLLFSYFYLASMARGPWPPSGLPELRLAMPNTVILLLSSVAMWWGESGIRCGSQGRLRLGLLVTFILGAIFLAIQGAEYGNKHFTLHTNAYSSLFLTITGFHSAHVFVGLLMNAVVQARAWLGHFTAERHLAVTNVAWYWHFVDIVWLTVFTVLYLSPHFGA